MWNPTLLCKAIPISHAVLERRTSFERAWGRQSFYEQSCCPLSLVAARFQSDIPRMPFNPSPKYRNKLPCVRITSVFANVKVKIYFQPLFPCPIVSNKTQKPLPTFPSHQTKSLVSSSLRSFWTLQLWRNSKSLQVNTTHIPQFPGGFSQCRHSAQLSCPCGLFVLKTTVSCTMPGAHKFFSTWFAAEQTHPNTNVPFEWCSQIYVLKCCLSIS